MSVTTYAELQTAIIAWAERTGDTAYTSQVTTFIELAESTFNKKIRHHEMEGAGTITLDASGFGNLPSDFVKMESVYFDGGTKRPLQPTGYGDLIGLNPTSVGGNPDFYAITSNTIYSPRAANGDVIIKYAAKIPPLTVSNTSNWLLDLAPDIYLFMALSQGEIFNENAAGAAEKAGLAFAGIGDLDSVSDVTKYGGAPRILENVV